jgi:hypothetical protein
MQSFGGESGTFPTMIDWDMGLKFESKPLLLVCPLFMIVRYGSFSVENIGRRQRFLGSQRDL